MYSATPKSFVSISSARSFDWGREREGPRAKSRRVGPAAEHSSAPYRPRSKQALRKCLFLPMSRIASDLPCFGSSRRAQLGAVPTAFEAGALKMPVLTHAYPCRGSHRIFPALDPVAELSLARFRPRSKLTLRKRLPAPIHGSFRLGGPNRRYPSWPLAMCPPHRRGNEKWTLKLQRINAVAGGKCCSRRGYCHRGRNLRGRIPPIQTR